jgi:hypothetical protein
VNQTSLDRYQILARAFKVYKTTLGPALIFSALGACSWFYPQLTIADPNQFSLTTFSRLIPAWIGAFIFWMGLIIYQYGSIHSFNYTPIQSLMLGLRRLIPGLIATLMYAVFVICGTLLLILPGLILSVTLMFSFFLVTTHKSGIMDSLFYSHRLVWGQFWRTSSIISTPILIHALLTIVSYLLLLLYSEPSHFYLYSTITQALIQIIILPYLFSVALCLMQDLEIRQQSKNLV